jgi:epoxide hydrolase-like predicted phosphatase
MEIKAIGFDWGGVIMHYPGGNLMERAAILLGLPREQVHDAYFSHNSIFNKGAEGVRLEDATELWRAVLESLGASDQYDSFMTSLQRRPDGVVNPRIIELIKSLRAQGWKLGLLSNNSIAGGAWVREQGYDQLFDVALFSGDIHHMKPEPEAFQLFAKELGVLLEEMVFIDDSQRSLSTAPELGYDPILFRGYEQLVRSLQSRNIL